MEFLFISGILFIASQVIPSQPETEEQKKKKKEKAEVKDRCEDSLYGFFKRKYKDESDEKIQERVEEAVKGLG